MRWSSFLETDGNAAEFATRRRVQPYLLMERMILDNSTLLKIAGGIMLALVLMRVTSRKSTTLLRHQSSERDRRMGARTNWQRRTRPGMQRTRSSDLYAY